MNCPVCHGKGIVPLRRPRGQSPGWIWIVCTTCVGSGIVYCCEGDERNGQK
jgi:hypothetical protein